MECTLESAGLSITELLPHRPPAVLIDAVLRVETAGADVRSVVRPDWPLADDNGVDALILIEVTAQAAGVCNGWEQVMKNGRGTEVKGYLVGVKQARFNADRLRFGLQIVSRVKNTYGFEGLREVACTVHDQDQLLAEITLQLFQA